MVDPDNAPIPIVICFLTLSISPKPEKITICYDNREIIVPIAESGTAPKNGRTTLPINPAHCGTNRSNSLPSEIILAPLKRMKLYAKKRNSNWTYIKQLLMKYTNP